MSRRRVTVFKNGETSGGKVISVPDNFSDFLKKCGEALNMSAVRGVFTQKGGEINEIDVIRDEDMLYVSGDDNRSSCSVDPSKGWITLNVGGRRFTTSRSNVTNKEPYSMLARMFAEDRSRYLMKPSAKDSTGAYLIDRSPMYFEPILNYLRNGEIIMDGNVNPKGVLEEAKFYGIESMIPQLEAYIQNEKAKTDDNSPLTRRDVIAAIIRTDTGSELRFQGVNLKKANLSKLDLRNINFKYACLSQCNLNATNFNRCCLERADLSHANLEAAQLIGVRALCANMEGANLGGCNLEGDVSAMLEGVNLKGANMEGSNMARVNLRVANLKYANLKNCQLRSADLAGADMEGCDLSGSDLQDANLRGTNLKDAILELMLTPLHMSQTVR